MPEQLTLEQRQLVEENHNLIYSYAKKHNLDLERHYDLLAIGLCEAAKSYNKDKGKFPTLAYQVMRRKVGHLIRDENAKKRCGDKDLVYYDDMANNKETISDFICKEENFEKNSVLRVQIQKCWVTLNNREREIVRHLYLGYGKEAILKKIGIGSGSYNNDLKRIRNKFLQVKEGE